MPNYSEEYKPENIEKALTAIKNGMSKKKSREIVQCFEIYCHIPFETKIFKGTPWASILFETR